METNGNILRINIGSRSIDEYILSIIVELNRGFRVIELRGTGDNICKVADVYVELKKRLGGAIKIIEGNTGTARSRSGRKNYMWIKIGYNPVGWEE